jgi:hypothetical protein
MEIHLIESYGPNWNQKNTYLLVASFKDNKFAVAEYSLVVDGVLTEETPTAEHALENLMDYGLVRQVSHNDKLWELTNPSVTVPSSNYSGPLGEDEYCDYTVLDVYFGMPNWKSRFAETINTRAKTGQRLRDINKSHILASLITPFAGDWDSKTAFIFCSKENLVTDIEIASIDSSPPIIGPNDNPIWHQYMWGVNITELPRLVDGEIVFDVQLIWNKDNLPCPRSTKLYVESDSGYLPRTKIVTDDNGKAQFKIMPIGLSTGEKIKIKVGSTTYSNISSIEVNA